MTIWSVMTAWCCAAVLGADAPVSIVIEPDRAYTARSAPVAPTGAQVAPVNPLAERRQADVVAKLQLQRGLRDARGHIERAQFADAIATLEPMLEQADGSALVLDALEAAYRGQLALSLKQGDGEKARSIAERLRVLAPGYEKAPPRDEQATPVGNRRTQPITTGADSETPPKQAIPFAQPRGEIVARGKLDEADEQSAHPAANKCALCLRDGDELFRGKDYREALAKYEAAYEADPVASQSGRERWGYCLLWCAVDRYNGFVRPAGQVISDDKWQAIEDDCRLARRLAPQLDFTDTVLASVAKARAARVEIAEPVARRTTSADSASAADVGGSPTRFAAAAEAPPAGRAAIVRQGDAGNGWQVAETENFRIYHREPDKVERIAQLAESGRLRAHDKWFSGEPLESWSPKCDLTIYPSASEYQSATGVGIQSPGHSKTLNDRGRVTVRQLFIRSDDPNMMDAVLPHEVAHIVFAGKFGSHAVPRWADEGMAVLTEPLDKQEAHLRNLSDLARGGQRVSCGQLLTAEQYPPGAQMRDFYAQSVGLCRHLVERGGERKLVQMIRTALQSGNYDAALRQTYGSAGIAQLENDFTGYLAGLSTGNSTTALSYSPSASPGAQGVDR